MLDKLKIEKVGFSPGYHQPFLSRDDKDRPKTGHSLSGAQQYLQECSYKINLDSLYHFDESIGTCAYNEQMEYTPVQLRINENIRHLHDNKKFLLQVWDKSGQKVLQFKLNHHVTQWAICFDYFIFKTNAPDPENEYFQIYNLERENSITMVEDFLPNSGYTHLVYNNYKFFAANENEIKIASLKVTNMDNHKIYRSISPQAIATINFKEQNSRLHGLALTSDGLKREDDSEFIHLFLEVEGENKIQINELQIENGSLPPYEFSYKLVQWREYIHREPVDDPIEKYQFIFTQDNMHVGVARRESKEFDIYYNGNHIGDSYSKSQNSNHHIEAFQVTYDRILFDMGPKAKTGRYRSLAHNAQFSDSKPMQGDVISPDLYFTEKIKNSCRLFSDLVVIDTNVFVAHGRHVSQFFLNQQQFDLNKKKHFSFSSYVRFLAKRQRENKKGVKINNIAVALENGEIHVIMSKDSSNHESWDLNEDFGSIYVPGNIFSYYNDPVLFKVNFFLTSVAVDEEGKAINDQASSAAVSNAQTDLQINLNAVKRSKFQTGPKETRLYIFQDKLHDLTPLLKQLKYNVSDRDQVLGLYQQNKGAPHFIYYSRGDERIYLLRVNITYKEKKEKKKQKKLEKKQKGLKEINPTATDKDDNCISMHLEEIDRVKFVPENIIGGVFTLDEERSRHAWQDVDQPFKFVAGTFTQDHLMLFSKVNCYKLSRNANGKFGQKSIELIPELSFKSLFISHLKHVYLIMDQKHNRNGLSYFDLSRVMSAKAELGRKYRDQTMWLQFAQVGIQSRIDYGHQIERLAYIKSYTEVNLIPSLHLNQVTFIAQQHIDNYIAIRQDRDTFYAISNEKDKKSKKKVSRLTTWDILTGKRMLQCTLSDNLSAYERFKTSDTDMYTTGLYDFTVLVTKEPIETDDNILAQYFDQDQLTPMFPQQEMYVKSKNDSKKFHQFKMIQITKSKEIRTLYTFIHPRYADKQRLFFSRNGRLMIEWLNHNRVFLYEKQSLGKDDKEPMIDKIKWKLVRRMENFKTSYSRPDILEFVSPDFTSFIDVDTAKKIFLIRDVRSEAVLNEIPTHIMHYNESPKEMMLKFKWVSNDMFKVINSEGIEKLVTAGGSFKQENFNKVHNYDFDTEKERHFYLDRRPLKPQQTIYRLIRKCQAYKSSYFMKSSEYLHEEKSLYEFMFTVDFQASRLYANSFFCDLSFSYITWRLIEQLEKNEISIEDLDEEAIRQITFTILPFGETALHRLFFKVDVVDTLFKRALVDKENVKDLVYSVPFLPNIEGQDPIGLCIERGQLKAINVMLKYLSGQELDHHSRLIAKHLPWILEQNVASFVEYMDSRNQQTRLTNLFTRESVNFDFKTPGIMQTNFWSEKQKIEKVMFKEDTRKQDIELRFMDLTSIHEFSDDGQKFFEQMANTDVYEMFDLEIVRKIILFKWPVVKDHIISYLFYPFTGYLISTCLFTSYLLHYKVNGEQGNWILQMIAEEAIFVFSLYFLCLELLQIQSDGLNYFTSIWNFIDIIPPVIQISVAILTLNGFLDDFSDNDQLDANRKTYSILMSIASLCLWIKFLYFFRIFDSTGFLITAILAVIKDMRYFLLILCITLLAFGDSYKVMSTANPDDDDGSSGGFIGHNNGLLAGLFYAYRVGLGDFDVDNFGSVGAFYCLLLFIFNTVITTIIMLNLFIAIISESFDNINSQGSRASYREKAGLIAENQFLLSMDTKAAWCERGKYLLYANILGQNEDEDSQEYKTRMILEENTRKLESKIEANNKEMKKALNGLKDQLMASKNQAAPADGQEETVSKNLPADFSKPLTELHLTENEVLIQTEVDDQQTNAQQKGPLSLNLLKKKDPNFFLTQEHAYKLLLPSTAAHDKWVVAQPTVWMEWTLSSPTTIRAYGLSSANDWLTRSPSEWTLEVKESEEDEWKVCHEVTWADAVVFNGTWQLKVFFLATGVTPVYKLRLNITKNCGDSHIQIGRMVLYE